MAMHNFFLNIKSHVIEWQFNTSLTNIYFVMKRFKCQKKAYIFHMIQEGEVKEGKDSKWPQEAKKKGKPEREKN